MIGNRASRHFYTWHASYLRPPCSETSITITSFPKSACLPCSTSLMGRRKKSTRPTKTISSENLNWHGYLRSSSCTFKGLPKTPFSWKRILPLLIFPSKASILATSWHQRPRKNTRVLALPTTWSPTLYMKDSPQEAFTRLTFYTKVFQKENVQKRNQDFDLFIWFVLQDRIIGMRCRIFMSTKFCRKFYHYLKHWFKFTSVENKGRYFLPVSVATWLNFFSLTGGRNFFVVVFFGGFLTAVGRAPF